MADSFGGSFFPQLRMKNPMKKEQKTATTKTETFINLAKGRLIFFKVSLIFLKVPQRTGCCKHQTRGQQR